MIIFVLCSQSVGYSQSAGVAVKNIRYMYQVPQKDVLKLKAFSLSGKNEITANNVEGTYGEWSIIAQKILFDSVDKVVIFQKPVRIGKNNLLIQTQSGQFNLNSYDIMANNLSITYKNLVFTATYGEYLHDRKIIHVRNHARLVVKNEGDVFC